MVLIYDILEFLVLVYYNIGSYPKQLGNYIKFGRFLVVVYDIFGDFWSSLMTTLVAIQNNLGHYISFRTFLVQVYDILGDFWSSFLTTLVDIEKNLFLFISFRTFLLSFMTFWEIFGPRL